MSWDFLQRYDDSWIWRHLEGGRAIESARNFAALEECKQDAARYGYVDPASNSSRGRVAGVRSGTRTNPTSRR